LDVWEPGEHNGTFRSNNLALVTACKALDYWQDDNFQNQIIKKSALVTDCLQQLAADYPQHNSKSKGLGLFRGIEWSDDSIASRISTAAFGHGLIIETTGKRSQVLKIMPSLTISEEEIAEGMKIIGQCMKEIIK
jgi:diaminobutyrate-2-oxoglutarate transaminase